MMKKSLGILALTLVSSHAFAQEASLYAGCKESSFVDVPGPTAQITTPGGWYEPKCLRVKVGTAVTVAARKYHPLQAGPKIGEVDNPFHSVAGPAFTPQTRTLDKPGYYAIYCTNHGTYQTGTGMAALIWVTP